MYWWRQLTIVKTIKTAFNAKEEQTGVVSLFSPPSTSGCEWLVNGRQVKLLWKGVVLEFSTPSTKESRPYPYMGVEHIDQSMNP